MPDKAPITIFVGSSTEHKPLADTVQALLPSDDIKVLVWDQLFPPGRGTLESLEDQLERVDFAVLILAPDDTMKSRDTESLVPRDNVLFELGLFMGRLGRERAFFLVADGANAKLPSDLLGITGIKYARDDDPNVALGPACTRIRQAVSTAKPRRKLDSRTLQTFASQQDLRDGVEGCWWEFLLTDDPSRLSFVRVQPDPRTTTVRLRADAYGPDGTVSAVWESTGAILYPEDQRVCYTWEGSHTMRPGEPYEGVGNIQFAGTTDGLNRGSGTYFNINLTKMETTMKQSFRLLRCTPEEIEAMESADAGRIRNCVQSRLNVV
jgi:hypothetical protein